MPDDELTLTPPELERRTAQFSADRRFRYELWIAWRHTGVVNVAFIGLNPSKADERDDDPTIRKCRGFAKRWGFGGMVMLNAYPLMSTDPRGLRPDYPNDAVNDVSIRDCTRWAGRIVACWGAHIQPAREKELRDMLPGFYCLGLTKGGHPCHPLYLPYETPLEPWHP